MYNVSLWVIFNISYYWTSQVELAVKNLTTNAGDIRDLGQTPGQEDPQVEGMATHSSWRNLWTEEPSRLQSTGSHRVGHN